MSLVDFTGYFEVTAENGRIVLTPARAPQSQMVRDKNLNCSGSARTRWAKLSLGRADDTRRHPQRAPAVCAAVEDGSMPKTMRPPVPAVLDPCMVTKIRIKPRDEVLRPQLFLDFSTLCGKQIDLRSASLCSTFCTNCTIRGIRCVSYPQVRPSKGYRRYRGIKARAGGNPPPEARCRRRDVH